VEEIRNGVHDGFINELTALSGEEITELYDTREIEG
jgi:hypothetical protein